MHYFPISWYCSCLQVESTELHVQMARFCHLRGSCCSHLWQQWYAQSHILCPVVRCGNLRSALLLWNVLKNYSSIRHENISIPRDAWNLWLFSKHSYIKSCLCDLSSLSIPLYQYLFPLYQISATLLHFGLSWALSNAFVLFITQKITGRKELGAQAEESRRG